MEEDQHIRSEFFYPPLWKQRRNFIQDVLSRFQVETMLDYGCGEASVLSFLISPQCTNIIKMAGIDLDPDVLQEAVERCMPLQTDFERKRQRPLMIDIFNGSIGIVDDRLKGYQAIVCSEVIEHLMPDALESFLDITLGIYQPEILIVTTPNGEYNVNFPNLKYGTKDSIFRHDDHKFEWTRNEFEAWCRDGAKQYKYNVEFHGIGLLHGKYDDLENGYCTQACIFTRSRDAPLVKFRSHGTPHEQLTHIEFPYHEPEPLTSEKKIERILYYIEALCRSEYYANDSKKAVLVDDRDINIDFEAAMDWENLNISEYMTLEYRPEQPKPLKYTPSPLHIPISTLWEISGVQEMYPNQSEFLHTLSTLNSTDFKLHDDGLIVYKIYKIDSESNSVSSPESDEDSF